VTVRENRAATLGRERHSEVEAGLVDLVAILSAAALLARCLPASQTQPTSHCYSFWVKVFLNLTNATAKASSGC